ncbi:hypothetical protein [Domibacillus iocasae]|uniref:Morphogenesis protein n=1 Tax=Domibacillus iocasae TaxID=1714016 RepID=A0A1E7DQ99_9BACI|nr:hypothetical protein [Domibacillus iocasae]OES45233.1 hypothetical protein BA724_04285 [Domibacillus iocasae]
MAGKDFEVTVTDENQLDVIEQIFDDLNNYAVEVGIFAADNSFYAMIANVHEYGLTIKPKKTKALTIPVNPKAHGKRASDFPDLFKPRGTNVLAIPKGKDDFEVLFVLMKSVTIPERSFVRSTFDEKEETWYQFLQQQMNLVLAGKLSVKDMYNRLGSLAAADIQAKMANFGSPNNSTATTSAKGSSSPLIDSGGLRQRVTWKVVKRNA